MTKTNSAELIFIVDRSGSMANIREDMEGGFQTFIAEQRKIAGECFVSLVLFDDKYESAYTRRPIHDLQPFALIPRGGTALLDAIGRTLAETGTRFERMPASERPDRVLVVVMTDGFENASSYYTRERIMEMIKHQRETYAWEFMFLGADQDAITEAGKVGIASALSYSKVKGAANAAFSATSASARSYRASGKLMSNDEVKTSYNAALATPPNQPDAVPIIVVNVATIPGAVKP